MKLKRFPKLGEGIIESLKRKISLSTVEFIHR
jgi:hypothetical protein